jgi:hypothetical protein
MTAAEAAPAFVPARELPNGANFYSPSGLFGFQADHVAEGYLRTNPGADQGLVIVWDTGLGKTIYGMALAALLFEDGQIDQVIVVAEKNKIIDWREDFEQFTSLAAHVYHGQGRQKRLEKAGIPHVLISTYDTLRTDLLTYKEVPNRKSKKAFDGPLMDTLGLRGRRTLWIFDEITAVKGRGSQRHKAFDYVLKETRKTAWQRVMGLTATPIERDIEDSYNIGRLVAPARSLIVADFERTYTEGRDNYQRYVYRNGASKMFAERFRPICLIKHKTDPDVIEQFPKQVEKALWLPLETEHRQFYQAVQEMLFGGEGVPQRLEDLAITILRMTAGHPASHLYAHNDLSKMIVDTVGRDRLLETSSTKSLELVQRFQAADQGPGRAGDRLQLLRPVCAALRWRRPARRRIHRGRVPRWPEPEPERALQEGLRLRGRADPAGLRRGQPGPQPPERRVRLRVRERTHVCAQDPTDQPGAPDQLRAQLGELLHLHRRGHRRGADRPEDVAAQQGS